MRSSRVEIEMISCYNIGPDGKRRGGPVELPANVIDSFHDWSHAQRSQERSLRRRKANTELIREAKKIRNESRRDTIYAKTVGVCFYCGEPISRYRFTIDHFIPRSKGGSDGIFNLVPACRRCNTTKRNLLPSLELQKSLCTLRKLRDQG